MSHRRFTVFISSTADLKPHRDSAEKALNDLDLDGSRFESWPSSPNDPISECLKRIDESDALILLLGEKYGTKQESGLSTTHIEYRHANQKSEGRFPIFVYLLKCKGREPSQNSFIQEVQEKKFRGSEISNIDELYKNIRNSFLNEFIRCFKKYNSEPPTQLNFQVKQPQRNESIVSIPDDPANAYKFIKNLYNKSNDEIIYNLKDTIFTKFEKDLNILGLYYSSVINLGMDNYSINRNELLNAIEFFNSIIKIAPKNEFSYIYNIGNAYSALKEHSHAIDYYEKSVSIKNDYAECWKNLGSEYYKINDLINAEKCLNKAIEYNPLLFEALYSLATLLINKKKNYNEAIRYLNSIILTNLSPVHISSINYWKTLAYQNNSDYTNAIACAENEITYILETNWGWDLLAHLYSQVRHLDKKWNDHSYDFFKKYIKKKPGNPEAYAELGFICWFLRDTRDKDKLTNESFIFFTKAIDLNFADDGLVWDRIGHLNQEKENWEEAEKAYMKACLINPKGFGYCLGYAYLQNEKYSEALPYLKNAAEKYQPDELSWHNLAVCYEKLNVFNESETAYLKAIKLDKNYALPMFNLGGLYWNNGYYDKAKNVWEKAIKKFPDHELAYKAKKFLV